MNGSRLRRSSSFSSLSSIVSSTSDHTDGSMWHPKTQATSASGSSLVECPNRKPSATPSVNTQTPTIQIIPSQTTENVETSTDSVQHVVYYFADSLEPITSSPDDFSFYSDPLRMKMIFKWMRYHNYYPQWPKQLDKVRRDELKAQMKLPRGFGQRLAAFMINKFNSFKKGGLVKQPLGEAQYAEYSSATDIWLSHDWKGNIESTTIFQNNDSRSNGSSSQKVPEKRPAWDRLRRDVKRPRSTLETHGTRGIAAGDDDATITVENLPPIGGVSSAEFLWRQDVVPLLPQRNKTQGSQQSKPHTESTKQNIFVRNETSCSSNGISKAQPILDDLTTVRLEVFAEQPIIPSEIASIGQSQAVSQQQKGYSNRLVNHTVDGKDLSKRLAQLQNSTVANEIQAHPNVNKACLTRHTGELGPLKEKEKVYVKALNESLEEFEAAKIEHAKLNQQYETLKDELAANRKLLDEALKRRQALIPPTPGVSAAEVPVSLHDALQTKATCKLLREIEEQKINLEHLLPKQTEILSTLETCISTKKVQLHQVQDELVNLHKQTSKGVARLGRCDLLLSGFQDFTFRSALGPTTPFECIPDSTDFVFVEEDDDDDD